MAIQSHDVEHIVAILEKTPQSVKYKRPSIDEEKDSWIRTMNFFLDEFMSKPFTTKEEVISELMLTYKISKR